MLAKSQDVVALAPRAGIQHPATHPRAEAAVGRTPQMLLCPSVDVLPFQIIGQAPGLHGGSKRCRIVLGTHGVDGGHTQSEGDGAVGLPLAQQLQEAPGVLTAGEGQQDAIPWADHSEVRQRSAHAPGQQFGYGQPVLRNRRHESLQPCRAGGTQFIHRHRCRTELADDDSGGAIGKVHSRLQGPASGQGRGQCRDDREIGRAHV